MTTREPDASRTPPPDPAFDAAWRAASSETPPATLDAAILAAAHRAVDAGPRRVAEATRPERWWWPLAAAATIGAIAVGILQVMPDRPDALEGEPAIVSDMPSAPPFQPAPAPLAAPAAPAAETRSRESAADAPVAGGAVTAKRDAGANGAARGGASSAASSVSARPAPTAERQAEPRAEPRVPTPATDDAKPVAPEQRAAETASAFPAAPPATTPPSAPTAPAPAATSPPPAAAPARMAQPFPAAPTDRRATPVDAAARREVAGVRGVPSATPTAGKLAAESAMGATSSTLAQQRPPLPVADWIALVRRLRAEGRDDEAARELAAFRRAHPNHPRLLPEDLRDWPPPAK